MKIKNRLTFQFVLIIAVIMAMALFIVYFFNEQFRESQFYERLKVKAQTTAKLLIEVKEVDTTLLDIINENNLDILVEEKIVIYNNRYEKIYDSRKEISYFHIKDSIINIINSEGDIRFNHNKYDIFGMKLKSKGNEIYALAGAFDKYGHDKLIYLRNILLLAFFLGLIIAFFAGRFFAGRAMSPISSIISQVDNISAMNLNKRLTEGNGKDEIAHLSKTFNQMLDRIEHSFNMTKTFVANASHEIRTPLTAISGQLEIALSKDRDNKYLIEKITSVLSDIKNLNELTNQLLSLAHISSETFKLNMQKYRIDDMLWSVQSEVQQANPIYKVQIIFEDLPDNEDFLVLNCDVNLLKNALINLAENACKFSNDKTATLIANFKRDELEIKVVDNGIGIDSIDIPYIFTPFFRGKNSQGIAGNGIGLSIVEKIIFAHNGTIEVQSEKEKGTQFTLRFQKK